MKTIFARLSILAALALGCLSSGFLSYGSLALAETTAPIAAEPAPADPASVQKQIDKFDPKAVAAAKSYFSQPSAKGAFVGMSDNIYQQVLSIVSKQHPELSEDQMAKIEPLVGDPLKRRLDLIVQMNILNALKMFSTDELVALDTFYASPTGQAIQKKMPRLTEQVPVIMQGILPDYLAEIKAKLKADKLEVEF